MSYNGEEEEVVSKYPFSCKWTPTAKGWRITVHTYANTPEEVITKNMQMLVDSETKLQALGRRIAPMEEKDKEVK